MRIALATCREIPEPDPDEALLTDAIRRAGAEPVLLAWDDPTADWSSADVCLIRSTWNYFRDRDGFIRWAERTAKCTRMFNGPEVVRWNSHKGYLRELSERGVSIVPTEWLARGDTTGLGTVMHRQGWTDAVVKPAVSAGSFQTLRVHHEGANAGNGDGNGEAHLRALLAERDAMVQGYVRSVEDYGERSLVWIDGVITHAVRKSPRFHADRENVTGPLPVAPDERRLAERALSAAPPGLLYARVDMARDERGEPMVMELELIEPSLFFAQSPECLERFVAATLARARA